MWAPGESWPILLDRARALLALLVVTSPIWGLALALVTADGLPDIHPTVGDIVLTFVLSAIAFLFWRKSSPRGRRILLWSLGTFGVFCALGAQIDVAVVAIMIAFLTWSAPMWWFFIIAWLLGRLIAGIIADLKDRRQG